MSYIEPKCLLKAKNWIQNVQNPSGGNLGVEFCCNSQCLGNRNHANSLFCMCRLSLALFIPLFLAHCIIIQRFRCEIFEFFPKDNFPVFDDDEKVVLTENNCQVVKIFYQTKKSNTPKLLQENLHNFPLGSSYIINSLQYTGHNHLKQASKKLFSKANVDSAKQFPVMKERKSAIFMGN